MTISASARAALTDAIAHRLEREQASYRVEQKLMKLAIALDSSLPVIEQVKAEVRTALDELQATTRALVALEVLRMENG